MEQKNNKTIGTHDGTFHCDEALACFMLRMTHKYKDAEIVRSRDEKVLSHLPILVDVGAVYDPSKGRFDHHQRGFQETFTSNHKIKLSSAGLIYKHFGLEILKKLTNVNDNNDLQILYNKVYQEFIEALDGIDNGTPQFPTDMEPNYLVNTDLSSRVGKLNPSWNENNVNINDRFRQAMELAGKEFVECVFNTANSWMPARNIVKKSIEKRMEVDNSGQIVLLEDFTAWRSHLLDLEKEMKLEKPILFVLYKDTSLKWRVQAVPTSTSSFNSRLPLHAAWCGLRDSTLSNLSQIPNCIFVHATGFIGGNDTQDGVLQMAKKSIALSLAPSTTTNQKV